MFELIVIIIICIVIWKSWFAYTDHLRKQKNRPIIEQREENLKLLIEDVLATIDRTAPNFKYITIYVRYTGNYFGDQYFEILSKCYLTKWKYTESDMLDILNMERSRFYDRKKEAIYIFGLSLWGGAIPKLKTFLKENTSNSFL